MELEDLELPELVVGCADVGGDLLSQFLDSFDASEVQQTPGTRKSRRSAQRRASVASSGRRSRARAKAERLQLKQQVKTLDRQLHLLRLKDKTNRGEGAMAEWEEKAVIQRHKRQQAELLNQQLKRAVVAQRGFLRGFMGVAAAASDHSEDLNLSALLHSYTRLRKDPQSRLQDVQRLFAEQHLDLATKIVLQETLGVSFDASTPRFLSRRVEARADEFAVTNTAVYSVDTVNVTKVFVAACDAYLQRRDPDWVEYALQCYQSNRAGLPTPRVRYNMCTAKYRSAIGQQVCLEGRGISYYRVRENSATIVWDFVDTDELYPLQKETDVKRDSIGAVVIRPELCEDGVERVVLRSICTKTLRLYSLRNTIVSQDIIGVPEMTIQGMKASMTRAYDAVQERHGSVKFQSQAVEAA